MHLLQSHIDEAIVCLEKARNAVPAQPFYRSRLASAYALRGETEGAAALAEARRLDGGDLFQHYSPEGLSWRVAWGGEDPRLVRSHLFLRLAQGRYAGGMTGIADSRDHAAE